jgi:hypothetical protein
MSTESAEMPRFARALTMSLGVEPYLVGSALEKPVSMRASALASVALSVRSVHAHG